MSCLDIQLPFELWERYSLHYGTTDDTWSRLLASGRLTHIEAWRRGGSLLESFPIGDGNRADARLDQAIARAIAAIRRDAHTQKGEA